MDKVTFNTKHYTRYAVKMPLEVEDFDLYIIWWDADQMSDIHDHADNGCIMKFLQWSLAERRYTKQGDHFVLQKEQIYDAWDAAYVPWKIWYHAIGAAWPQQSVSLHVYSPAKFKTTFFGKEWVRSKDVMGTVVKNINTTWLQHSEIRFRRAKNSDKEFVDTLMETIMRPYAEEVFPHQKQADMYMKVNSAFDPESTVILEVEKDNKLIPIGRIAATVEFFDEYPALVIHQLQISQEFRDSKEFSSVSFFSQLIKEFIWGAMKKSLGNLDMPILFQIIKRNPLKKMYSTKLLGFFLKNITDIVWMHGWKRDVYGYFPVWTEPQNYSYSHKRALLKEQGIFGTETQEELDRLDVDAEISEIFNEHRLLDRTVDLIKKYLKQIDAWERKVIEFHEPTELRKMFDFDLTHTWVDDDEIFRSLQDVLNKSVATQHPRFFNQLYAGANIYSTIAERVTAILNTSMYTYEVGPLFTLMEEYVYSRLADIVGREKGHDGMMLPGWSNANLTAMQMARYAYDSDIHQTGLYGKKKLYVLTSDEAHYSITKSAMLMWMGKKSVIKIATNELGQMDVKDLEAKIISIRDQGGDIYMINATSGTTVMGAYDNLTDIAQLGKKYDIRTHVDMIWWWTVMFDDQLKKKITGIEYVDSFSRNPHKMMGASLQCSVRMTQRPNITATCNVLKTQYLFNDDKWYGVWCDTGDKYTQCGRRVDVLKLRLLRKSLWDSGIAANTRKAFDDARYLSDKIHKAPKLYLYQEPQCTNINFWYIPDDVHLPHPTSISSEWWWISLEQHEENLHVILSHYDRLHSLTARIKDLMLHRWEMMTWYTHTKWFPNFFRMVTISPKVTHEDLDFVVQHIQELGEEVEKNGL